MTILNKEANTLKIMSNQKKYRRNIIEQKNGVILAPPDTTLIVVVCFLVVIGIMAIFSASSEICIRNGLNPASFAMKQFVFFVAGFLIMLQLARTDYKQLSFWALPFAWFIVGLLLIIAFTSFGVNTNEATRWIQIGSFQFQPSEMAKPAFILVLANAFKRDANIFDKDKIPYYLPLFLMLGLIFAQPNLSMVMLLSITAIIIFICAGGNFKYLLCLGGLGVTFLAFTIKPYQLERILTWFDPTKDPQGAGYNILQSLYAVSSGGFWGSGFGQSRQKFGWLPECHTDFIYSIIAEELGFFGCVLVVGLFWTLMQRGITIASRCPDKFGKLVAVGITFSLGVQALLNMGVATSFLPATGVPLPFVSYGGTSILVSMAMIGILLNISRKRIKKIDTYQTRYSL